MKLDIYSVYDSVAKVYSQPFFVTNLMVAQRIMKNCVKDKTHQYGANPSILTLNVSPGSASSTSIGIR